MNTIASALKRHKELNQSDSARLDCELLLCRVLKKERAYLYTWPEKELSQGDWSAYLTLFERRKLGEPIAHILGEKEFWSLSLLVDASTLIPRPETELLVELALELLDSNQSLSVLDLGTGTGAIALALASERSTWALVGLEKNHDALALAKKNQRRLNIENVQFYLSDWFAAVDKQRFHLIVSNPPYIEACDHHLREGDVRFEPLSALVADAKGMADIETIIQQAPLFLEKDGWLLLEHGNQQGQEVRALFERAGFSHIKTHLDLAGHERVSQARWVK